jgi:ribosomal protein L28
VGDGGSQFWDKESCQICNKKLDFGNENTHYHHKKMWSKNGKSDIENGILVCNICHLKKIHGKKSLEINN